MATIVLHKQSRKKYVLIGTGYGAYMSTSPSFWGGDLLPNRDQGEIPVAAVSDQNGLIQWFLTDDLQVVEIDGKSPHELLLKWENEPDQDAADSAEANQQEQCPACLMWVSSSTKECPSCGLTLISEECVGEQS